MGGRPEPSEGALSSCRVEGAFSWLACGAIAVVWNPVLPIAVPGDWWLGLQYLAGLVVVAAGMLIRVAVVPASGSRTR